MKIVDTRRIIAGLIFAAASTGVHAQYAKLDGALKNLLVSRSAGASGFAAATVSEYQSNRAARMRTDDAGRILVDIYLDGSVAIDQFTASLAALGASITGVNPGFNKGAVSAYVPIDQLVALSGTGGLNLVTMTMKPQANVGLTTSQGTTVLRSNVANAGGFTGTGITVGVLSDSYDTSPTTLTTIRAANDIASNDLKAPKLVIDLPTSADNTDEGRGMMQIVHDVAPAADLCFATAFAGEAAFASNIRTLRTNPACAADVIVDDVFYFDEPFYSDGQVAQAVTDVTTSSVLAGKKVSYFSSAGNQGSGGGGGSIDVPNAVFSAAPSGLGNIGTVTQLNAKAASCLNLDPTGTTQADVGGGWLDFGGANFAPTVTMVGGAQEKTLMIQWDDRFYSGAVTTDLNWFMFDSSGNCVLTFASNNFSDDNGTEVVDFVGGPSGTFRFMIARTTPGAHTATRVRIVNIDGYSGGLFATLSGPTTFGHSAAANANSVAAYRYSNPFTSNPFTPRLETFSSPGPVTIAFDAVGNRLAVAETRKKPDFAAPDGGNTTFFFPGTDPEPDGFPNFFGTSAAAPHAAGVAALLLQKAGGPNSLTPAQVKSILQTTAPARAVLPSGIAPGGHAWNVMDGWGMIDAVQALHKIAPTNTP